tara:strand:+ start:2555 stop:2746 length:192 start_codon:yes stop_codon:yes gene_type:complete
MEAVKLEVTESQLIPLPGLTLSAFAKSLIAERDGDATGATSWLSRALKQEAKEAEKALKALKA